MHRLNALAALLAVSTLGLGLGGCANHPAPTQSGESRPSLRAARQALAEGSAATALGIAGGVLTAFPNDVPALVASGDAEAALGQPRTAEETFNHALAISPTDVGARLGLGKLKLHTEPAAAEAQFRAILTTAPSDPQALTDLGVSLDLQDRHAEAQAAYTRAIAASPDLASARIDLALSLALSGDPVKAEQMLRDATESAPPTPRVRANFALAQVMAGHSAAATTTLEADLSQDEAVASVQAMEALKPPAPAK